MTKTNIKFLFILIIAGIISGVAYFFVPILREMEIHSTVAITLCFTITLLAAVCYFLSSLKSFKVGLKVAYYLLAAGIVCYSFILAQFFIALFVDLSGNHIVRNGLFLAPYGLASFLAYLGMRKFARLLGIKNIWTSFIFVLAAASVTAFVLPRFPYPDGLIGDGLDKTTLELIIGVLAWCIVFGIGATMAALYVRNAISQTYRVAMTWMTAALTVLVVSATHELIVKVYFFDSTYAASEFVLWPFILTGIVFLRAGLSFKETQLKSLQLPDDASYIDVVAATAQLVSTPAAIDNELDKLRNITAHTSDPKQISEQDRTALKQLYLYLEDYLITQEPLSKFSRENLRDNLPKDFAASLGRQISSDVFHTAKQ